MNRSGEITAVIELRGPLAAWVLFAHGWALLVPLALIAVLTQYADYVAGRVDYPWGFYVAAGIMMAGSAFEISQNTIDRWYLTKECASAEGKSLCDLLFFWMIVASQAVVIITCFGSYPWLTLPVAVLTLVYPWFYVRGGFAMLPLVLLGTGSVAALWFAFQDPVVFLQLLVSPLTGALFNALLRTGAQFLHGFVTLVAASNPLFIVAAVMSSANGEPTPWSLVAGVGLLLLALIVLLPRLTNKLHATPRF